DRIKQWRSGAVRPLHLQHGEMGERAAKKLLRGLGLKFLTANFRSNHGEIDLVFRDADCLVFVEVKSRSGTAFGTPAQAVNIGKQQRLRQTAQHYLIQRRLELCPLRFDVISIVNRRPPEVEHIIGAF
ncbi:MAG: YraN family protein, partial [candidate division WOR-3 bacterium]